MSIGPAKLMTRRTALMRADRHRYLGFTLLEIMLAVAILGMMALAIFRFCTDQHDRGAVFIADCGR